MLEEATPEESSQVQQWLAADAANRAHFEKLQTTWQLASKPNLPLTIDTPDALQRLKQTIRSQKEAPVKRIWTRVWTAAAAIVGIAGVALGAYVWMKPNTAVKKEQPPVVQPDTVLQKPVRVDTIPAVQPVPALQTDSVPVVKPHKKKRAAPVPAAPAVPRKKKTAQPPAQPAPPVRKHKTLKAPKAPTVPVKEPPIS